MFCHGVLKDHPTLESSLFPIRRRDFEKLVVSHASEYDYFMYVLNKVEAIQDDHTVEDEKLSWYIRHRTDMIETQLMKHSIDKSLLRFPRMFNTSNLIKQISSMKNLHEP